MEETSINYYLKKRRKTERILLFAYTILLIGLYLLNENYNQSYYIYILDVIVYFCSLFYILYSAGRHYILYVVFIEKNVAKYDSLLMFVFMQLFITSLIFKYFNQYPLSDLIGYITATIIICGCIIVAMLYIKYIFESLVQNEKT
ncbi:hypothetical protein [Methanosarcina acetivorans]|uniref:Uncharacterized protein n=1 Tax=Methanosarcina acetivorans (strain ATCC 35395 / DSM 2834 / JCM 12185 / C2A) TaxID=188937 RepID=Q8TMH7_METAC|nr:hypothetical protein [Methanosarcina acetivorans]AAM06058.1 predicted protein [Methanosarcina acetivorans C2A]